MKVRNYYRLKEGCGLRGNVIQIRMTERELELK
jgi:hypothetical protein